MTSFQFSFFGGYTISRDNLGKLDITRRKVMGLLAFLALEAGQAHSRETLLGLLWPEMGEADARNNLRVALAGLRKRLRVRETAVPPLTTSRRDVRLQLGETISLDVADFQALLAESESHTHADRAACPVCRQRLAAAAALYHGPLLHGLYLDDCPAFDEWLFVQRERFHLQALEVLEELAQGLEADGRFAEAATHTRRQLELDSLHDSAQRRLLRLLAYQGQTAAALSQFEAIKKTLHAELGIEPDVELLQLAQQIKDGTLPIPDTGAAKAVASRETTAVPRHNLPEILTPFIGRETELTQLAERLAAADYRLITLAGPGGIGKTRLALEAARANLHRFADGAFFVPLDGVANASEIPAAIAAALNVTFSSDAAPAAELLRILQEKQLLLVVDNLEHIIEEGAALLLQIVRSAPQVVLLITSRERLNVQAEDLFRLHGLPYPDDANAEAGQYAAVRLFADRAHRLQKTFRLSDETLPHVARICRLVEGLPLGLELAATWVRDLSVAQIVDSLAENIDLLATDLRDISPRHRNLAAVFEYSWQLLTADEQAALSQLAVFRGSFTPAAAGQVANASPLTLTRLRYKSLIRSMGNGRYTMHELLRQLALRKLNEIPATAAQCRTRHCHYFLGLLATQAELLNGAQAAQVGAALGLDLDNIRHAWRCAAEDGDGARLRQSAAGLAAFFAHMGLGYEGAQLLQTAVASLPPQTTADNDWLPYLLTKQLSLLETFNPLAEIKPVIERILALTESDPALAHLQAETYLLWSMGLLEEQASPQQARVYLDKAFASAAGSDDPVLAAWLTCELGRNYLYDGQFEKAILVLQEALATFESLGHLPGQASVYSRLAPAYAEAYNLGPALVCDQEALRIYSQINYRTKLSRAHNNLAETLALLGAYLPAHDHACKSLALSRQQNDKVNEANTLTIYATCLEKLGQTEEAEKQYRTAITAQKALNLSFALRFALLDWGDFLMRNGRSAEAAVTFADALAVNQELEHLRLTSQAKLATAYLAQGKSDAALTLADEVWPAIEPTGGSGLPFPIHTMVECYTVFQAHGDGRAGDALDMAAVVMERTAVAIDDPEMRASFLNNVPVNRQLQAALQQASAVETPTPPPIQPQAATAVTDPRHRFVVQEMLAVGGQGELYLGHDRLTEKRVVVKQLKAELLAQDPELVQRLVQEGEILRRLNHPNVVQMLAAYEIDGVHHIVMEYVPGGTLRDLLNQTPQPSLSQTLAIGLELADALSRAHHLNVIHRDIKPDNVLLAADGTPRLTDFGVARLMEKGGAGLTQAGLTQAGALIGSLAYMSPEALRGEAPDARSDIWSFGVLLFEMLAGFHPYGDQSEQVTAVLIKILNDPPPDLLAYCPDAPPPLLELLQKMLVKERDGRIASMRQVAAALETIRDDLLAASAQGSV